jgi:hypothetical protein
VLKVYFWSHLKAGQSRAGIIAKADSRLSTCALMVDETIIVPNNISRSI